MFSSRTRWQRGPNRLARELEESRRAGRPIIDLTLSNPTLAGLPYPDEEIRAALSGEEVCSYAPDPRGMLPAREAVAGWYGARGVHVDPSRILLTASSSEAYSFLFRLLCEPGDAVLVPAPSYPLFDYLADLNDVRAVPYRLTYDGAWHIDASAIGRAAGPRCRAVVLVHPNNPTGSFIKRDEIERAADAAHRHGMALIVDEVFFEYPFGNDSRRARSTADNAAVLTFTINGLSKSAGLPQMKLGWLAVSGPPEPAAEALERLEVIADTYLSVGTPVQQALPRLLELEAGIRDAVRERTRRNLGYLTARATDVRSVSLLAVEGGWYATLRVPATRSDEEWTLRFLREAAVYAHPGFLFDMTGGGHVVVSLLAREDAFREGVEGILRVVSEG